MGEIGRTVFAQDTHDIYVLGDIHGDFEVLRKCLEDCAQVCEFVWISDANGEKKQKMGKPRWTGGNAYVVVCGDIIDRHRPGTYRDKDGWGDGEYADEEYDILLYLTILDRQARKDGGRVFRLLGNHEIMNVMQKDYNYASPGTVRQQRPANMQIPHGKLSNLLADCNGVLQIGDWLFVHGGLLPSLISKVVDPDMPIDASNNFFTRIKEAAQYLFGHETSRSKQQKLQQILKHAFLPCSCGKKVEARESDSFLWNDGVSAENKAVDCAEVKDSLKAFIPHIRALGYSVPSPDRLHIVVGHSTQTYQTDGYIFTTIDHSLTDRKRIVLQGPAIHYERQKEKKEQRFLGINFTCPFSSKDNANDGRIWRTDACMSRAFDFPQQFKQHAEHADELKRYLFARQPQVLCIRAESKRVEVMVSRRGPDRSGLFTSLFGTKYKQQQVIRDSDFGTLGLTL